MALQPAELKENMLAVVAEATVQKAVTRLALSAVAEAAEAATAAMAAIAVAVHSAQVAVAVTEHEAVIQPVIRVATEAEAAVATMEESEETVTMAAEAAVATVLAETAL